MKRIAPSRSQIDKLGERLASGKHSVEDLRSLDQYRRGYRQSYNSVLAVCRKCIDAPVSGRPSKSTTAIVEKLQRESTRLSQIQDIAGCRIVVEESGRQELVISTLEVFLGSSRKIDRRTNPSHGYRAVHLVSLGTELPVEIQVRTALQHRWAELSEKFSDLVDHRIKYGQGNAAIIELLSVISSAISSFEATELARYDALKAIEGLKNRLPRGAKAKIREANEHYFNQRRRLHRLLDSLPAEKIAAEARA